MDVSRLKVAIPSYQITEENGPVAYAIAVEYGKLSWDVWRRYSQFAQLYRDLDRDGYCALPSLPGKTLAGAPYDPRLLADRRHRLQYFLLELLRRPDTRTAPALLDFLLFSEQASLNIPPLRPWCVCNTGAQRFAVSSLVYSRSNRVIIVGHEDKTGLSRLGRLWSLVEPDEFGMINVWAVDCNMDSPSLMQCIKTQPKVRCMFYDEPSNQLFVGQDDGKVSVYILDADELKLEKVKELDLHTAAVMHLAPGKSKQKRLLSLGFDGAIRVIDITTHQMLSGGRMTRRLGSGAHLTVGHFDDENDTVYLGTSGGQVLVYAVKSNPPSFIQGLTVHPVYPVETLIVDKQYMFLGHGEYVSVISVEQRRTEQKFSKVAVLTLKENPSPVLSMVYDPKEKRLLVGYDPAIAWWSIESGQPLCVWEAHGGGVHQLLLTDRSDIVLSGGDSGNSKIWRLPPAQDLRLWQPPAAVEQRSGEETGSGGWREADEIANFSSSRDEDDGESLHAGCPRQKWGGTQHPQGYEPVAIGRSSNSLSPGSARDDRGVLRSDDYDTPERSVHVNDANGRGKGRCTLSGDDLMGSRITKDEEPGNAAQTSASALGGSVIPPKKNFPTPFEPKSDDDDDEDLDELRSAFS
ncbi:WD domain, G-beta repeat-containing protein [Toxoplasma gondii VEG]|uniref:PX domain and WD40 repeat-containing protein n=2 Tax=Toxoplasma gondii TaxID=5811 RepID=B9Q8G5_TOXGV|nr:WD domain, G-beta repeat-containing protein [Toxoplasma gondii VEG]CEL76336.1 TPA: PX domain and WD40 repeat-containing protein [Toxoplasma gondii VEG]